MPNASNLCPHPHVKRLDVAGWIKPKQKCNIEVKVKCVMLNKQIDGLTTNHSHNPLPKQKKMWALDVEEMESSSKIDLRDMLWWMSIKGACTLGVVVTTKVSKERCIFLAIGGRPSHIAHKHD